MANDIQRLRQQQIFGGFDPNQEMMDSWGGAWEQPEVYDPNQDMGGYQPMQPVQTVQQPGVTGAGNPPPMSFEDRLAKIMAAYTPETSARDRQNKLLDNYPQQYEPTTGDRWAAGLLGLGERNKPNGDVVGVQNQILQGPRIRDIEDWKNQITPAGVASTNENARNIQERSLLTGAVQADTQAQRLEESARQADQKAENVRQRNMIADYVARGAKVIPMPHSPTIWMTRPDGTPFDTKVPTGAISEAEAINAKGGWQVQAAQATAAANPARNMMVGPDGQPMTPGPTGAYSPTPGLTGPVTRPGVPSSTNGPRQNELDARRDAQIRDYAAMNPGSNLFFFQDPVTKSFTMADPPEPPNTGLLGNITGSAEKQWQKYSMDMQAYNKAKKVFFPNEPPSPIVGYDTPAPNGAPARKPGTVIPAPPNSSKIGGTPPPTVVQAPGPPRPNSNKFNPAQAVPPAPAPTTAPQSNGYAPAGKQPTMSAEQQTAGVTGGQMLWVYDQSGNRVGTIPNHPVSIAEAQRMGMRVGRQ